MLGHIIITHDTPKMPENDPNTAKTSKMNK